MATSREIRQQFIGFFVEKHGHTAVPSSPVVPLDDDTLLFANAGMNQFKDVFLGLGDRPYTRAVDTQKCIRAGGKHNDLDDVGKDTYHHTFFEMLGNWSFGDYFKAEAIDWAWQLLVNEWKLDPDRLHATYFEGDEKEGLEPDHEARELWLKHLPPDRVHPGNKKDNFWEMGDTGPCGPCSEIHYDRTPGKDGGQLVNADSPAVIEIWNLVFIQFNRAADGALSPLPAKHVDTGMGFERITAVLQGVDSNYDTDVFTPIFDAIQKVTGARAYQPGGDEKALADPINVAYRVIADHIRTLTFAITDGAHCGNAGRDSVLRSILRRAVRFGRQTFGVEEPFFYKLVPAVVESMGDVFPEITKSVDAVMEELKEEEVSFRRTLDDGIKTWWSFAGSSLWHQFSLMQEGKAEQDVEYFNIGGPAEFGDFYDFYKNERLAPFRPESKVTIHRGVDPKTRVLLHSFQLGDITPSLLKSIFGKQPAISGVGAFMLYETYGFPIDLTTQMAEERGMTVDLAEYERLFAEHQEKSKGESGAADAKQSLQEYVLHHDLPATAFTGDDELVTDGVKVVAKLALTNGGYEPVEELVVGQPAAIVLDTTPFYAEAGGQVGDAGVLRSHHGAVYRVTDTIRFGDACFHLGELEEGCVNANQVAFAPDVDVLAEVDADRRAIVEAHHTCTHVLNHKLRAVLGEHVQQRGSLVDDEKTRFDFAHTKAVAADEVERIETLVNDDIAADLAVNAALAAQEDALQIHGLRAVFGEKYPPKVRVVSIGPTLDELLEQPDNTHWHDRSIEFCGGTHLASTGKAEGFAIIGEEAVGKGIRRLTAVAGALAAKAQSIGQTMLDRLDSLKNTDGEALAKGVAELTASMNEQTIPLTTKAKLQSGIAELQKVLKAQQKAASKQAAGAVVEQARAVAANAEGDVIVASIDGADGATLRTAMDVIRKTKPDAAMLLGAACDNKIAFLAAVPQPLIDRGLKAGDWVREVAKVAAGGGGGRPDMAQAGGKDPAKLDEALDTARNFAAAIIGA